MNSAEEACDRLVAYLAEQLMHRFKRYQAVAADLWRAFGTSPDDTDEDRRRMLGPRPGERSAQEAWDEFLDGLDLVQFIKDALWPRSKEERERRVAELFEKVFGKTASDLQ